MAPGSENGTRADKLRSGGHEERNRCRGRILSRSPLRKSPTSVERKRRHEEENTEGDSGARNGDRWWSVVRDKDAGIVLVDLGQEVQRRREAGGDPGHRVPQVLRTARTLRPSDGQECIAA